MMRSGFQVALLNLGGRSCQAASIRAKVTYHSETFGRNLHDVCGYECDNSIKLVYLV